MRDACLLFLGLLLRLFLAGRWPLIDLLDLLGFGALALLLTHHPAGVVTAQHGLHLVLVGGVHRLALGVVTHVHLLMRLVVLACDAHVVLLLVAVMHPHRRVHVLAVHGVALVHVLAVHVVFGGRNALRSRLVIALRGAVTFSSRVFDARRRALGLAALERSRSGAGAVGFIGSRRALVLALALGGVLLHLAARLAHVAGALGDARAGAVAVLCGLSHQADLRTVLGL